MSANILTINNNYYDFNRAMDKKMSNKRKSSATTIGTPKKIKKTTNVPVSPKIDKKSLKLANKIIINENNSHKSPPQRKQKNGKQITLKSKKANQIEEDEMEDESDDSMDILNGENGNSHDAVNSDNEVVDEADSDDAENDEVNSDEVGDDSDEEEADSDVEEANSDEEDADSDKEKAESDEEVESDGEVNSNKVEADSDEAVSDEEVEENEEDSEDEVENKNALNKNETIKPGASEEFKVFVFDLTPEIRIEDVFRDCNIKSYELGKKYLRNGNFGRSIIFFEDKESEEKALKIKQKEFNGHTISVCSKFQVYVKNMSINSKLDDIFKDWKIQNYVLYTRYGTQSGHVHFEDEESLQKALKIKQKELNGHTIYINSTFQAVVKNFSINSKLEDIFKDCKLQNYNILPKRAATQAAIVYFEDEESLQKALLKHDTEYDGHAIRVFRHGCRVWVGNLNPSSKLQDLFWDCDIHSTLSINNDKFREVCVTFKNEESMRKALSKNNSIFDGRTITVELRNKKIGNPIRPFEQRQNLRPTGNYNTRSKTAILEKNNSISDGRTITELRNRRIGDNSNPIRPFKQRQNLRPTGNYNDPRSKIAILEKKLRLEKLKMEAQQLEQEIYGNAQPF